MNIQITQTSLSALNIIHLISAGTVHSVYRKTINLTAGDSLLALQAQDSPLSPVSLITDLTAEEIESLQVTEGLPVRFTDDSIRILRGQEPLIFSINRKSCVLHSLNLASWPAGTDTEPLIRMFRDVLFLSETGGFDVIFAHPERAEDHLVLAAARQKMQSAEDAYLHSDWPSAAESLIRLIGLGSGLTPSGDDFLCGVLAGITLGGFGEHIFTQVLRRQIENHLQNTNDISRTFLSCALQGQYSLAVNSLALLSDYRNINAVEAILSAFLAIGHSSGIDTLCGIYYILRLMK